MSVLMFVLLTNAGADSAAVRSEYAAKLTTAEPTAEAQFKLALWARRVGLAEEADGHLRAAVYLDPDMAPAQKALGRVLKAGLWETKAERQRRLASEAKFKADRAEWLKRLNEGGVECAVGPPLNEAAVAALEDYASRDEQRSLAAVKVLAASPHGAATAALLRQAVASRFDAVRKEAAAALAARNPDHYLVNLVECVRQGSSGAVAATLGGSEVWQWRDGETLEVIVSHAGTVGSEAAAKELEDRAAKRETTAAVQRRNAAAALEAITGQKLGEDFAAWRDVAMQVLNVFIDPRPPQPRRLEASEIEPDEGGAGLGIVPSGRFKVDPPWRVGTGYVRARQWFQRSNGQMWPSSSLGPNTSGQSLLSIMAGFNYVDVRSCFASGTLVATKRGEVSIEEVRLGELVLSRDIETGETIYKPVLTRTLRPATAMRKIEAGRDVLHVTPGHYFWTDAGWRRAYELPIGAKLDGKSGKPAVWRSEPAEPGQAYNLVVADYATYFVGKERLLVHDNTPIRDATPPRR